MSTSEAAELRAAAAEKAALLAAAEERLARLEALHRVAQVPVPVQSLLPALFRHSVLTDATGILKVLQ